jgi:SAM-dependent methyltransferase
MCGTGKVGLNLSERFRDRIETLVFADGSAQMLGEIPDKNKRVLTFSENFSFANGTFDVLVSRYGINNIEEDMYLAVLKEYLRTLTEGGIAVIQDHFPTSKEEQEAINTIELFIGKMDGRNDEPFVPTKDDFEALIQDSGGEIKDSSFFTYRFSMRDRFRTKGLSDDIDLSEVSEFLKSQTALKYELEEDDITLYYPITTFTISRQE